MVLIVKGLEGYPRFSITGNDADECECGDYRSQHEDGVGKCLACRGGGRDWGDAQHGPCQKFVLYEVDE